MKKILLICFLNIPLIFYSQSEGSCVSGDCENGVGSYLYGDGSIYDGSFINGVEDGIGTEILYDDQGMLTGVYQGEWEDGWPNGWGTEELFDENGYKLGTYVGEWKDGNYDGWGIWIGRDKFIEKGIWKDNELINEIR